MSPASFLRAAATAVTSAGRDVPKATIENPTKPPLSPHSSATVVAPETNEASTDKALWEKAAKLGAYRTSDNLRAAAEQSDVIYTDTWIDMEYFEDPAFAAEKQRRIEQFQPFQVNREILRGLNTAVMHCLPAHRGYEIEGELLEDPRSLVFHQAENRLHSQKAVLLHIAGLL